MSPRKYALSVAVATGLMAAAALTAFSPWVFKSEELGQLQVPVLNYKNVDGGGEFAQGQLFYERVCLTLNLTQLVSGSGSFFVNLQQVQAGNPGIPIGPGVDAGPFTAAFAGDAGIVICYDTNDGGTTAALASWQVTGDWGGVNLDVVNIQAGAVGAQGPAGPTGATGPTGTGTQGPVPLISMDYTTSGFLGESFGSIPGNARGTPMGGGIVLQASGVTLVAIVDGNGGGWVGGGSTSVEVVGNSVDKCDFQLNCDGGWFGPPTAFGGTGCSLAVNETFAVFVDGGGASPSCSNYGKFYNFAIMRQ